MAENNRPRRRETNVTEDGLGVHRRDDEGLGTGPVGSGSGMPQQSSGKNIKQIFRSSAYETRIPVRN